MYYALVSRAQLGLRVRPAGHVRFAMVWAAEHTTRFDEARHPPLIMLLLRNIGQTYAFASSTKLILRDNFMASSVNN